MLLTCSMKLYRVDKRTVNFENSDVYFEGKKWGKFKIQK